MKWGVYDMGRRCKCYLLPYYDYNKALAKLTLIKKFTSGKSLKKKLSDRINPGITV